VLHRDFAPEKARDSVWPGDINALSRRKTGALAAAAAGRGRLKVFRYTGNVD
jgi:hypothetical protein